MDINIFMILERLLNNRKIVDLTVESERGRDVVHVSIVQAKL